MCYYKIGGECEMKTKDELPVCPVATAVSLIGGKWKLLIIRNLKERPWRFNELQRDIEGISQRLLTDSLRQMIDDDHSQPAAMGRGKTERKQIHRGQPSGMESS